MKRKYFTRHNRTKFTAAGGLEHVIEAYRERTMEVGSDFRLPVVDLTHLLKDNADWKSDDGVHPTPDSCKLIARLIAARVKPLLRQLR